MAEVPRTATVQKAAIQAPAVAYAGDPKFEPIEGTKLQYGTNTNKQVILVNGQYYLCYNAVWFRSSSPTGPWAVASSVPSEVYAIPRAHRFTT